MLKLGEGILTFTSGGKNLSASHAKQNRIFVFWHHIVAEFGHKLKIMKLGYQKIILRKKNNLC